MFADVKALTRGFSRRASAHDIAGNPDDAVLLAEQVERLDGFFGEADNSTRQTSRPLKAGRRRNQTYLTLRRLDRQQPLCSLSEYCDPFTIAQARGT